jgi:hypothetical protein
MKMTVFWDVLPSGIALMMEATNTSETRVKFYQSTRATSQKTVTFTLHAARSHNPTKIKDNQITV